MKWRKNNCSSPGELHFGRLNAPLAVYMKKKISPAGQGRVAHGKKIIKKQFWEKCRVEKVEEKLIVTGLLRSHFWLMWLKTCIVWKWKKPEMNFLSGTKRQIQKCGKKKKINWNGREKCNTGVRTSKTGISWNSCDRERWNCKHFEDIRKRFTWDGEDAYMLRWKAL